jgi:3-oxoacyl-[acyl-carrier-protein] synthase II
VLEALDAICRGARTCVLCRDWEGADPFRWGTLVGSAMGGMKSFAGGCEASDISYKKMNPFCIPFSITNMGGAMLAMDTGFMGPNYSLSTACATGNFCFMNAYRHIQDGDADLMLAGATDAAVVPTGIGGFIACKALSTRNDKPAAASRPWDKGRDGFVLGEGSGVMVLESLEHAQARGARIYAELLGGAANCDAHHITEPRPDGSGVAACLSLALKKSGVSPAEVNYVNAHGTSTPAGDVAEYRAITSALPHKTYALLPVKS